MTPAKKTSPKRQRREYLRLLDSAKEAAECAIDNFNRSRAPFRLQATLLLLATAWELLSKAILVHSKVPIRKGSKGETISGEVAVSKLLHRKQLEKHEADVIQQIISLRNAAAHEVLPPIPVEVQHHLLYYGCKFFREIVLRCFKNQARDLERHYLSLSFSDLTTYADKVQKSVARMRRSAPDRQLVWLLERGITFDGSQYMTMQEFELKVRGKNRILPYLALGEFLKSTDMVRIVPVEAPKNYTADISLRKGKASDSSLPVLVKKTNVESDYPYLTRELADHLGKGTNFVAKAAAVLGLKGDPKYHLPIRSSKSGEIHRYSEAARSVLALQLRTDASFNPWKA